MKHIKVILSSALIALTAAISAPTSFAQVIKTVAGNGTMSSGGDGGAATAAQVLPMCVAADGSGNYYIGEPYRVRKVNSSGTITTIAGDGTDNFSGDGGAATAAKINIITGIASDASGNVYISTGTRIRKITAAGTINTIAGDSTLGFAGDGGPATAARFDGQGAMALDGSGNLFVVDMGNHRVRKIATTGIITTVAGNGTGGFGGDGGQATAAQLHAPYGVAADASGNIFIADFINGRVRKVTSSGIITTIAGTGAIGFGGDGGPATAAVMDGPRAVAIDAANNIYVTDDANYRIRKINTTGVIATYAGTGINGCTGDSSTAATSARLATPYGLAVDASGNLLIADVECYKIRKVSNISTAVGSLTAPKSLTMTVLPNPAKEQLLLHIASSDDENLLVIMTNILGQKVKEMQITANKETEVQLNVPAGIYYLSADTRSGRVAEKIVVE